MKQRVLETLTRYIEDQKGHAVIAKKSKDGGGNARSKFLKAFMPLIDDKVVKAFDSNDMQAFTNAWTSITTRILDKVEQKTKNVEASLSANITQLRQKLVQLKRQNRQKPDPELEKQIDALAIRINNLVEESVPEHQRAMHDYDRERIKRERANGERS